jgi:hypothetical protein
MSLAFRRPRLATVMTAALPVIATGLIAAPTASAETTTTGSGDCISYGPLHEESVGGEWLIDKGEPGMSVGDVGTYHDVMTDASGEFIGTADGLVHVSRVTAQGDVIVTITETLQLPGGTARTIGVVNQTASLEGDWQTLYAVGTSGDYLGKVGTHAYRLVQAPTTSEATVELCG